MASKDGFEKWRDRGINDTGSNVLISLAFQEPARYYLIYLSIHDFQGAYLGMAVAQRLARDALYLVGFKGKVPDRCSHES